MYRSTSFPSRKGCAAEHRMSVCSLKGKCADAGHTASCKACSRPSRGQPLHCIGSVQCLRNMHVQSSQVYQRQPPQVAQAHGCSSHADRPSASLGMAAA